MSKSRSTTKNKGYRRQHQTKMIRLRAKKKTGGQRFSIFLHQLPNRSHPAPYHLTLLTGPVIKTCFQLPCVWECAVKGGYRISKTSRRRKKEEEEKRLDIGWQLTKLTRVLVCWVFADLNVSVSFDLAECSLFTSSLTPYQTFMSWYHRSVWGFWGVGWGKILSGNQQT